MFYCTLLLITPLCPLFIDFLHVCTPPLFLPDVFSTHDYPQGGMKAVVWTDTFQMLIIVGGVITLVVNGCLRVGGLQVVLERAAKGGRLNFNELVSTRKHDWGWGNKGHDNY